MFRLKNQIDKKSGFSLLEILIYLGILSVFLIISFDLFFSSINVQKESSAISMVNQDGRFIMLKIMYDISNSSAILSPLNPGDSTNILQLTVSGANHVYYLDNSSLMLTDENGTQQLNSLDTLVDSLNFAKIGEATQPQTVSISFNIKDYNNKEVRSFSSTFGQR